VAKNEGGKPIKAKKVKAVPPPKPVSEKLLHRLLGRNKKGR
jgi:hypothetical protein